MTVDWYVGESGVQHVTTPVDFSALSPVVVIRRRGTQVAGPLATTGLSSTNVDFLWPAVTTPGRYVVEIIGDSTRRLRIEIVVA